MEHRKVSVYKVSVQKGQYTLRTQGRKKNPRINTQYMGLQSQGIPVPKGPTRGEGCQIKQYLPSTSYMEVNGISTRSDPSPKKKIGGGPST